jgi:hypothetical protein
MPCIVAIHGIGQQFKGPDILHQEWLAPLRDGVTLAGGTPPAAEDLVCAFYGNLFRPPGMMAVGLPPYDETDVTEPFEQDLLAAWWCGAAKAEPGQVLSPEEKTMGSTPRSVQRALNALSRSRFFAGLAERAFVDDLKQVSAYFRNDNDGVRRAAARRVENEVKDDTRVMVGHSLGSVVAYEVLCSHPEWPVTTLVTLGSPWASRI